VPGEGEGCSTIPDDVPEIGEKIGNDKVIGYACTWMSMTCSDLGLLDDALNYGSRPMR